MWWKCMRKRMSKNEYDRIKAQEEVIAATHKSPKLIKLAITHESISKRYNPNLYALFQERFGLLPCI